MTPDQMQARSSAKVKQVTELMKILQLRHEVRERIDGQNFIEKVLFWIDDEKYPAAAPTAAPVVAEVVPDAAAENLPVPEPVVEEVPVPEPIPEPAAPGA